MSNLTWLHPYARAGASSLTLDDSLAEGNLSGGTDLKARRAVHCCHRQSDELWAVTVVNAWSSPSTASELPVMVQRPSAATASPPVAGLESCVVSIEVTRLGQVLLRYNKPTAAN